MPKYNGADVVLVREIRLGDADFHEGRNEVVVRGSDGTERKILRSELEEDHSPEVVRPIPPVRA